jgi:GNAT superfamily N-acetyltransferase
MQMKIEEASEDDIAELKDLAKSAIIKSVDVDKEIKKEIIADTMTHIERNISGSERVFLKYSDSAILGFILVQNYWNLSDLFVSPKSHGKGIGRQLFGAAKKECIAHNNKSFIRVNSSLNAEGFYRKMGFVTFTPEKEAPSFVVPLIYNF